MDWVKSLLSKPWVATLLGLGGIIFGVYQLLRRQKGKLVYKTESKRLIGGTRASLPDQVDVFYRGEQVPRLSRTRVVVWNSGRSPIRRDDISNSDPLRLILDEESEILEVDVIKLTRESNQFEVSPRDENNSVLCTFDFLDRNYGATFEVLHTGPSGNTSLVGTLIGIPEGAIYLGDIPPQTSTYQDRLYQLIN